MILLHNCIIIPVAFLLDLLLGDPKTLWHPVQGIGAVITMSERLLQRMLRFSLPGSRSAAAEVQHQPGKERIAGVLEVMIVLAASAVILNALLHVAALIHPVLRLALEVIVSWQMLAARSLKQAAMDVYRPLKAGNLPAARLAVSMIVGRDTECLDETGVTKAAVETVAENTSDGVIAPLIFLFLFGPMGGLLYKAVNTMDSMIGYRNARYLYFGTAAARLDDILNFIPSRLAAVLMILSAAILGLKDPGHYDVLHALKIWRRDRRKHPSPNSAQTESACAGALHVRLAGPASYFGVLHEKPYLGDPDRPIEVGDISRACHLMMCTTVLTILLQILCAAQLMLSR